MNSSALREPAAFVNLRQTCSYLFLSLMSAVYVSLSPHLVSDARTTLKCGSAAAATSS